MIKKATQIVFLLASFLVSSQELKDRFEDSDVAFEHFISTYEYYWDETSQSLKIKQTDEVIIVPLKTNARFSWPIFYNDEISLGDIDLRNQKGRKYKYQKVCGHVEQSGIFYSDAKVCTYEMVFTVKNEKIKLTSSRVYRDPRYFTKINLPFILPGKSRIVKIIYPQWVNAEFVSLNFDGQDIETTETISNDKKSIQYKLEWPNAFDGGEKNTPSTAFYSPHLIALTKSYLHPKNGEKIELINNVRALYNWYKTLVSNVDNQRDSLTHIVSELTQNKNSDEKIKSIYYWVQDNIKYIAFEDGIMGFQPEDAHSVFDKKYGDCKGMANLLKTMLKIAGFDARLSWLGTNHIPYSYEIPSLVVDNHMICSVIENDKIIYLDATVKFNKLNYTPGHIQGKEILIEAGDDYLVNEIPIADSEENFEAIDLDMTIVGGTLKSTGNIRLEGDSKQFFLYMYNNLWNTAKDRFVRSYISQSGESDDFNFEIEETNRDSILMITVATASDHLVSEFDGELYIQMELRNEFSEDKINFKRVAPYAFPNRRHIRSVSNLPIPDGYKVTFLPEPLVISSRGYSFNLKYEIKGDKIYYLKNIDIDDLILTPDEFESWNESIKKLNEHYNNSIILSHED